MDMAGKDTNVEPQKGSDIPVNYHAPNNMSSDWQINGNNLTNASIGMISMVESITCSSAPMIDSFCRPIWDQPISGQSLAFSDVNGQNNASNSSRVDPVRADINWTPNAMLRGGMILPSVPGMIPQSLPHFPADSAFIERAARFSCFGGGNFGEMMNPFSASSSLNPYSQGFELMQGPQEVLKEVVLPEKHVMEGSSFKSDKNMRSCDESKHGVGVSGNESDEAEFSGRGAQEELDGAAGESSGKGIGCKKRKRGRQDNEHDENNEAPQPPIETAKRDAIEIEQKDDQNPASTSKPGGKNGKQGSQGSEPPKEEYIHVRARRGQATNSHSLAERVRREKISERMKFLQDLVPGCNKVTGKAVMLDEIINYVQSLQRQVEFLSMKLATVNPRLDFNIEGFLAKDILQPRAGISSSLAFPPDMTMPFPPLHPSQPGGLIQTCLPGNSSETLRRPINLQSTAAASGGFKESTSQIPNVWEDELHNIVHMGFNSTAALNSQDLSDSLPPGHVKAEP